ARCARVQRALHAQRAARLRLPDLVAGAPEDARWPAAREDLPVALRHQRCQRAAGARTLRRALLPGARRLDRRAPRDPSTSHAGLRSAPRLRLRLVRDDATATVADQRERALDAPRLRATRERRRSPRSGDM